MPVTIEQARATLPEGYHITDKELKEVIADAYLIANLAVNDYLREKQREKKRDD